MPSQSSTTDSVALFAALADRTRLRLLNLLGGSEVCVCYLVEILGQSQAKVSRHLAYLRRAGIVAARREGKWIHYRIVPPPDKATQSILLATQQIFAQDPEMQGDLCRMTSACCAPEKFSSLRGAPRPLPTAPGAAKASSPAPSTSRRNQRI